jgi:hypothetical protein
MQTFKTNKGTQLPILNLKGKDYLQVAHRLVWFREECPRYRIETEFAQLTDKYALAKATIRNDSGEIMATAHKREDAGHFGDYAEKAETGAIGRALAYCGFGTQFCADELDEGVRIVDAPMPKPEAKTIKSVVIQPESKPMTPKPLSAISPASVESLGVPLILLDPAFGPVEEYVVPFGKKYKGKKLKEITQDEIASFSAFLQNSAAEQGKEMNAQAKEFVAEADKYLIAVRSKPKS